MRAPILLAVMLVATLAGCTDDGPQPRATMTIEFAGQAEDLEMSVTFRSAERPAAVYYSGKSVQHPDAYTVHDLIEDWREQYRRDVTYDYFDGLGFSVRSIAGVEGDYAAGWWWALFVGGEPACSGGITDTVVMDGLVVGFHLTPADTYFCT